MVLIIVIIISTTLFLQINYGTSLLFFQLFLHSIWHIFIGIYYL